MLNNYFTQLSVLLCSTVLSITSCANSTFNSLSLLQITEDVSYLASDELKGRSNFSAEINQAADYIAQRFAQSGLIPAFKQTSFQQKYSVIKATPNTIKLQINEQLIATEKLAFASSEEQFTWHLEHNLHSLKKSSAVKIHTVNKNQNMQAMLRKINNQGGEHLVLIHTAHASLFKRYQAYFSQGSTKLALANPRTSPKNSIVIALTDIRAEQVTQITATATSTLQSKELSNVVALLPGTSNADEFVLYSAHYDHLGTRKDDSNTDNIYNGADDDASGVAAILNLADYFAKQGSPKRSLLFAAFSAEEIGGFGSKYFAQQLDSKQITAMINIEMIGKASKFGAGTVWMTGMDRSTLGEQLNAALSGTGRQIYQDPYPEQGLFYRSDNATLARLGVPAHSFSSTQLDTDQHYHQPSDELASLNLSSLHKVITSLAIATQPLVDGQITPSRIDVNLVNNEGLIY